MFAVTFHCMVEGDTHCMTDREEEEGAGQQLSHRVSPLYFIHTKHDRVQLLMIVLLAEFKQNYSQSKSTLRKVKDTNLS